MVQVIDIQKSDIRLQGALHKGHRAIPILIVHGFFSSNKNGPYRLYYHLAEYLNNIGYTVLRVDLSAMGESEGDIENIKFKDHIDDVKISADKLLSITGATRIHILAHCIGCSTALCFANINPKIIESITMLAPFIPKRENIINMIGKDEYTNTLEGKKFWYRCLLCDSSFIDAADNLDNESMLEVVGRNKYMVFLPDEDELSHLADGIEWVNKYRLKYSIIKNANHNFCTKFGQIELLKKVQEYYATL